MVKTGSPLTRACFLFHLSVFTLFENCSQCCVEWYVAAKNYGIRNLFYQSIEFFGSKKPVVHNKQVEPDRIMNVLFNGGMQICYKSLLQVKAASTQTCQLPGIEFSGVVEPFNLAKFSEI